VASQGIAEANQKFNLRHLHTDYYVAFSPRDAAIYEELDRVPKQSIFVTGYPEFDKYLQWTGEPETRSRPYFLLIDQPWADNPYGQIYFTRDEAVAFYRRLAECCGGQGAQLTVKLHPESYRSDWLPDHPNIVWIREHPEMMALVEGSLGCFGFSSTLLLPIVPRKKITTFRVAGSSLQNELEEFGVSPSLNPHTFTCDEIFSRERKVPEKQVEAFVRHFLFSDDGGAQERLEKVILG
jgi:hypothetical protein